jgi:hypothetical protein
MANLSFIVNGKIATVVDIQQGNTHAKVVVEGKEYQLHKKHLTTPAKPSVSAYAPRPRRKTWLEEVKERVAAGVEHGGVTYHFTEARLAEGKNILHTETCPNPACPSHVAEAEAMAKGWRRLPTPPAVVLFDPAHPEAKYLACGKCKEEKVEVSHTSAEPKDKPAKQTKAAPAAKAKPASRKKPSAPPAPGLEAI